MIGSNPTARVDLHASVNARFAPATLSGNVAGLHFRLMSLHVQVETRME